MGFVTYGQIIGIFSSEYQGRLDIGTKAMKVAQSADHVSWATKLRIQRVDGPSIGCVEDSHVIGIFSEDNRYRLDLGTNSMKELVPATHESWATELKIWPATNKGGQFGDSIKYGDLIGVFSADGNHRLDIGEACLTPQKADHVSWATKLLIQEKDPVVQVSKINSMTYNLKEAKKDTPKIQNLYTIDLENKLDINQTFNLGETFTWTDTKTFSNDVGFKVGTEVSGEAGIPLVTNGQVKVSAEVSFNHKWGTSYTETNTVEWKAFPVAPPNSTIRVLITVAKSVIEVPYKMDADVKRLSGKWDRVEVPGMFTGKLGHDINYTLETFDPSGKSMGPARAGEASVAISVQ